MDVRPDLIVDPVVMLIGVGLYLAGYLTRALLSGKKTDKPSKPRNTEPHIVTSLDCCKSCINSYEGNPRGDGICKECERRNADDC